MIDYEIKHICYKCICRVCGQAACPHRNDRYKRCFHCWSTLNYAPILDCKNFYFRFFPRYRIKRVYSTPKIRYVDKTNADDIRVMLTEILTLLKSPQVQADINCIRNKCLCLDCPGWDRCDDKCNMCRNYKGEHPVKLCARRLMLMKY